MSQAGHVCPCCLCVCVCERDGRLHKVLAVVGNHVPAGVCVGAAEEERQVQAEGCHCASAVTNLTCLRLEK